MMATVDCPLCGASGAAPLGAKEVEAVSYPLARCAACALVFVTHVPAAAELQRYYDRLWAEESDPSRTEQTATVQGIEAARFQRRLSELSRLTLPGQLLDVGCKDGAFLCAAHSAGWTVAGVELSAAAAQPAHAAGLHVFVGALEAAPFAPGRFDVVTLWHIIEHVPRPLDLLRAIHRVLKPQGLLAIETPNIAGRGFRRHGLDWQYLTPPAHLRYFSTASLRAAFARTGYTVVAERFEGGTGVGPQLSRARLGGLRQWALAHYRWVWPLKRLYLALFGRLAPSDDIMIIHARKREPRT